MVELYEGALDVNALSSKWYKIATNNNYGAYITFVGVVRDEHGIEGLSFDIYEPILERWFEQWLQELKAHNAYITMAHSRGDVLLQESSFMCAIYSSKRRFALETIDRFVEDFKANAPIWKYDIINAQRVYARERSHKIEGSGLLKGL